MNLKPSTVIKTCIPQALQALAQLLRTAQEHAKTHEFDEQALLQARLFPDMQTLIWNAQMISEFVVRASLRLSGKTGDEIPSFPFEENSIDGLLERIENAVALLKDIDDAALDNGPQTIEMPFGPDTTVTLVDQDMLLKIIIPNLHFHVSMVYAMLRTNGVAVGKMDYLGPITPQ